LCNFLENKSKNKNLDEYANETWGLASFTITRSISIFDVCSFLFDKSACKKLGVGSFGGDISFFLGLGLDNENQRYEKGKYKN